jgi:glutamine amidotransferase
MSKKNVVIVDYGHGNLFSINQACIQVGYNPIITSNSQDIINADSLILPGVGAFKIAMTELINKNLVEPISEYVKKGNYLMGVCLGMQLLFETSEEFGNHKGLGFIKGKVEKFPESYNNNKLRVPHIGWNNIQKNNIQSNWDSTPLKEISEQNYFYFIHKYYAKPTFEDNILSISHYQEMKFCSSVQSDNIFGFQFHPEKSAEQGISIYKNFLKL